MDFVPCLAGEYCACRAAKKQMRKSKHGLNSKIPGRVFRRKSWSEFFNPDSARCREVLDWVWQSAGLSCSNITGNFEQTILPTPEPASGWNLSSQMNHPREITHESA